MPRCLLSVAAALIAISPLAATAKIPKDKVKIGVLQDLPRPFAQRTGFGAIVAAQLAAADFETEHVKGDAEILPGDSKSSADDDVDQVRDWIEKEDVAAVLSSAPADVNKRLAPLLESHHRTLLITSVARERANEPCAGNVVVWGMGADARARALVQTLVPHGGQDWLLVGEQSAAGLAAHSALQDALQAAGGQVTGTDEVVPGSLGVSGLGSKTGQGTPQVIALMGTGADLVRALRSAQLTGLTHQATLASPFATIEDVDQAGAETAQGLVLVSPFYWNSDDTSRRFARRWQEREPARHVSENAAQAYAAALSFLHAAKSVEDIDSAKIGVELRRAPIQGTLFGTISIGGDGRVAYDLNNYRVKAPAEIHQSWDYLSKLGTTPAAQLSPAQACAGS